VESERERAYTYMCAFGGSVIPFDGQMNGFKFDQIKNFQDGG
jgi:hypothetical protein